MTVALHQNYPNPFNPVTTIRFDLPAPSHVTIRIYSMLGEEVGTLVDGEWQAGLHQVVLDATHLASGVYVCRMQTGNFTASRKLLLVAIVPFGHGLEITLPLF